MIDVVRSGTLIVRVVASEELQENNSGVSGRGI